ncbi:hypothetical protein [Massilia orientalis]|uniref:Uncharacterized protein n=1 Tax=Massilia orientalis TaxID=3050128 RepID=A0ACC7MF45_9BURK|nr:hypothetical protein [Massilia sp. YIM B02787]
MTVNTLKLHQLVFYAIDRFSGLKPALDFEHDTLGKLGSTPLPQLKMSTQGITDMWQTINAYTKSFAGGAPVSDDAQSKCVTVLDVWNAVCKAAGVTPAPDPDSLLHKGGA